MNMHTTRSILSTQASCDQRKLKARLFRAKTVHNHASEMFVPRLKSSLQYVCDQYVQQEHQPHKLLHFLCLWALMKATALM